MTYLLELDELRLLLQQLGAHPLRLVLHRRRFLLHLHQTERSKSGEWHDPCTHRFTDKVWVDVDLGVGGAAVNRHRRTWRRFGVSYWPGWVDLLNLHVQLRNKAHTPRSEHWWLT